VNVYLSKTKEATGEITEYTVVYKITLDSIFYGCHIAGYLLDEMNNEYNYYFKPMD